MSYHIITSAKNDRAMVLEHTCDNCYQTLYLLETDLNLNEDFEIKCSGCNHINIYEPLKRNGIVLQ